MYIFYLARRIRKARKLKQRKIGAFHSSLVHSTILGVLLYFKLFSIHAVNYK